MANVKDAFDKLADKYTSWVKISGSAKVRMDPNSHLQGLGCFDGYQIVTHSDRNCTSGLLLALGDEKILSRVRIPPYSLAKPYYNHPGGCQSLGQFLVVPVETIGSVDKSYVTFFDASDPLNIREVSSPPKIDRPLQKAGAAGITSLTIDGTEYWLLGVYDRGWMDLYLSDGRPFPETEFTCLCPIRLDDGFQSVCLLTDVHNQVFAVTFGWKHGAEDWSSLYAIDPSEGTAKPVAERHFYTDWKHNVHFRWAAGVEIISPKELALICSGRVFWVLPTAPASSMTASIDERSVSRNGRDCDDSAQDVVGSYCRLNTIAYKPKKARRRGSRRSGRF